jgi:opacity protein-like surface antigen
MKRVLCAAAVFAVFLGCAAAAPAQQMEAGIKFGYAAMTGDHGDAFDGALSGGPYLTYYLTPNISLQGSWLYHKHDKDENAQDALNALATENMNMAALTDLRLTMNEFDVTGRFYSPLPWEGARVFALAGAGLTYWKMDGKVIVLTDFDKTEEESFWDLAVNLGGGFDYAVTEQVKLGAEIVYSYIFGDFDGGLFNFLATASYGFSVPL